MSKQRKLGLSRRRVLASIGAIGVASAGAGLGTTAYFSDEESFEGNTLTAGELDLKVDWQQTYNGPIPAGENAGQVGEHAVNAYPDTPLDDQSYGDGLQDLDGVHYSGAGDVEPVFNAAEIPACCDCGEDEYYVTYGGESYCIEPLSGEVNVGDFYEYGSNSSQNSDITRADTSVIFLYEDAAGDLSLVIVNDDTEDNGGGAATYTIEGAPGNAEWLAGSGDWQVQDDGDDPYAEWTADWAWYSEYTDGGALGPLSDDFALRLSGAFNGAAAEEGRRNDDGMVENVVILSGGSDEDSEIVLESGLNEDENNEVGPVTIHSSCGIDSGVELETPAVFRSENYPEQEHLVEFDDVKPGDSGEITFSLHLCDNPGYVWMTAANFAENAGAVTEPEIEAILDEAAGNDAPTTVDEVEDSGHLAEHVQVTVWYDEDCDNVYDDPEDAPEGEDGEEAIFEGTLRELMENTFELESEEDEGMVQLGDDCYPARAGFCIGFEWEVPTEVGNIIQGDEAHFDLGFYTEQCRHNEITTSREGDGWAKAEDELSDTAWHARGIYGDGGGAANREIDIRDPGDNPIHSGNETVAWPNGESVPFELTIDGGDAKWTVDGSEVMVSNAPTPVANGIGVTAKASTADADVLVENVQLNGSTPSGPDSVAADGSVGEQNHIILEGVTLEEGDVVTGDVTFTWTNTPSREGLGFRIDV